MIEKFRSIIFKLFLSGKNGGLYQLGDVFSDLNQKDFKIIQNLNTAFMILIAGNESPLFHDADTLIKRLLGSSRWKGIAGFYMRGIDLVLNEINDICRNDTLFRSQLQDLFNFLSKKDADIDDRESMEKIWAVFFPEALGIGHNKQSAVDSLRSRRIVNITELNDDPVTDPVNEILFTSNVLMTIPPEGSQDGYYSNNIRKKLGPVLNEKQLYWFDHPIQIGVKPENNEVLYGLKGLEDALAFEQKKGSIPNGSRLTCLLSISVTHKGLQELVVDYLREQLGLLNKLKNLDVYAFTEADTEKIKNEILIPGAIHYLGVTDAADYIEVFGVNGEYGRHYSFLKAIAPLWKIMVKKDLKGTFKIDLDQVFPQKELVDETGLSAFEHFLTPLWGAKGTDNEGNSMDLGMIAGALVNEKDISKGLFTPDVAFPANRPHMDEHIFFSPLPQALSTESEMMTKYGSRGLDGRKRCISRIHVTGGTNGILIKSLKKYRPFTPSFIGRAEDQAYLMSVITGIKPRLAYVHKDGLIMRHDKESFAGDAIESARMSKIIGDYIRILYFSKYGSVLPGGVKVIKKHMDPFTGCFISKIPFTIVYLRFCLKAAELLRSDSKGDGFDLVVNGSERINRAVDFISGNEMKHVFEKEQKAWNLYYDVLSAIEDALKARDDFGQGLKARFNNIIKNCMLSV